MDTNVPPLLYEGSSRDVYRIEGGMLAFHFKDTFSVFDIGMHPQTIPGKAEALCECAVHSFKNAKAIGIETHFVEQTGPRSILVEEMATEAWEPDQPKGRLIPLEFITRFAVAGSLLRDFKKGKKKPTDYGFATDDVIPAEGTWLPWPVHEITTKREDIDRPLTDEEAMEIGKISPAELERIWRVIERCDGMLSFTSALSGYRRLDGKKEVAITSSGRIVLADTFGTLDEDRYAPADQLKEGTVVHYSKEIIRKMFIDNGYFKAVEEARAAGREVPPYPMLTKAQIDQVTRKYEEFTEDYRAYRS